MADLVVIVPSRNRPPAVAELAEAFTGTVAAVTALMFVFDDDDPTLGEYVTAVEGCQAAGHHIGYGTGPSTTMVEALNGAAHLLVIDEKTKKPPYAVGFMGDDHRPRTVGWDQRYLEALREFGTGMVYGNDLLQGGRIPTQVAMTADIIRALGWMAPPPLTHLYVDDFWMRLGADAACIRYLPDVVVEHMHPVAGKADWDEGHTRVNAPEMYERDRAAWHRFRYDGSYRDAVAKVQALRGVR